MMKEHLRFHGDVNAAATYSGQAKACARRIFARAKGETTVHREDFDEKAYCRVLVVGDDVWIEI